MKILMLLSKSFITDDRVNKEAKALVDDGNEVVVVFWDRRNLFKDEEIVDGIRVIRIKNSFLMNLVRKDVFRNPIWWKKSFQKGLELYKGGFAFDVVHCHDLDTLKAGVNLKNETGCKLVYDAHEVFGYMILETMPKLVVDQTFEMEKKLIQNVDHVITVNHPVKKYLESITDKPITLVMNCKNLISKTYQPPPEKQVFTMCYFGGLIKSRKFPELVDIIGGIDGVRFVLSGMKSGLFDEVKERCQKYDNVEFLGTIPSKDIVPKTFESNATICMFEPDRIGHQIGLPNKIFESMVTGRPIIVTKDMYYSDEFVEKEKFGLAVSNDEDSIRKAVIKLRDNPELQKELGKNGIKAAMDKYNWEKEKNKLLDVYKGLK